MRLAWPRTPSEDRRDWADRLKERLSWLESPLATYYLILGTAGALVSLGLIMVFSASSVKSYQTTSSAFTMVKSQAIYAVIGIVVAFIASRLPVAAFKKLAFPIFLASLFLQSLVLVPGIARTVNGNTNWIGVGGFTMQPSETGKLALTLILALVLYNRRRELYSFRRAVFGPALYVVAFLMFVMIGGDLGTTMVIGMMTIGILWTAGVRARLFAILGIAVAIALPLAVWISPNRTSRISAWLSGCKDISVAACYQSIQGNYALADGGVWGLGPGGSRESWGWLPEAHNDFIFAIIGEELGLPGTLLVLCLYLIFAYACYRLIASSHDYFVRIATAGIMVWICFQAIVNIGSVIGFFPIVGVPLPLVSYGGSALVITLSAIGVLLSFARSEPAAREALTMKPRLARRMSSVIPARKGRA